MCGDTGFLDNLARSARRLGVLGGCAKAPKAEVEGVATPRRSTSNFRETVTFQMSIAISSMLSDDCSIQCILSNTLRKSLG